MATSGIMEAVHASGGSMAEHAGRYLTFTLGQEHYGVAILRIQEIVGMMHVTHVPRAPDYIHGVVNLRGRVIPVVDLRTKFLMPGAENTERTCIVVVQVPQGSSVVTMGVRVDEVSEVLQISSEQIEPAPSFGNGIGSDFILAMGKVRDKVVMLLDIDRVLAGAELPPAQETTFME